MWPVPLPTAPTQLTDDDIEQAENTMRGYPCPECGAYDWLAEERDGDHVRLRCDDCCRYGVLIRMPEGLMDLSDAVDEPRDRPHPCEAPGCQTTVPYDDEPYCLKHSPEAGSPTYGETP